MSRKSGSQRELATDPHRRTQTERAFRFSLTDRTKESSVAVRVGLWLKIHGGFPGQSCYPVKEVFQKLNGYARLMADKKFYVISYDIVADRRRTKAAETLKDYGRRVQKSVFECRLEAKSLNALLSKLKGIIDKDTDNVLVYLLCEACVKQKDSIGLQVIGQADEEFRVL